MLSRDDVNKLLFYDEVEGQFYWLVDRPNGVKVGDRAGAESQGRLLLSIHGHRYLAHRVAWLIMTGEWPEVQIDHKDTNPLNNAWHNLRVCGQAGNSQNRGVAKNNKLGIKGVRLRPSGKYQVRVNGLSWGEFESLVEATARADHIRAQLHKEFARG